MVMRVRSVGAGAWVPVAVADTVDTGLADDVVVVVVDELVLAWLLFR
jgi:hypothetical protein